MKMHVAVVAALTLAAGLALPGCASAPAPSQSATTPASPASTGAESMLAAHGLTGLDTSQIIERLDRTPLAERPANLIASVRPGQLLLSDDQEREASLPLPADKFYVSFAPYLTRTHDCHFHSLTTCVGELQNADVQVTVVDAAGETLVDEQLRTYDNGFLGLWLPRDLDATLTVEYQGRTATQPITTSGDEAATCLTTLALT